MLCTPVPLGFLPHFAFSMSDSPSQSGGTAQTFSYALGTGLNVGFICTGWHPDPGGVPSLTRDLARGLGRLGHRVYVLCLDMSGEREPFTEIDSEEEGDIAVRRVAYAFHDHGQLIDLMEHAKLRDVVLGWMAETPCDVIHVHHLTGFGGAILRAVHDVGQPLVMTLHDYWMLDPLGQMYGLDGQPIDRPEPEAWTERIRSFWPQLLPSGQGEAAGEAGREADKQAVRDYLDLSLSLLELPEPLLTPSNAAAEVFARAGVPRERLRVVPNAVAASELAAETEAERAKLGERGPGVHLGLLGTVLPSKGALELAQMVVELGIPGLVLDVHGEQPSYHGDSSYLDALRALAKAHECIVLHGAYTRAELPRILAGLDGVAAPSRWEEVYGLTVREARAAGLPLLVTDQGDLPAVTDGGRAGWVCGRDDAAAWAAALGEFCDPDARAAKSGLAAGVPGLDTLSADYERAYIDAIQHTTGQPPDYIARRAAAEQPVEDKPKKKRGLMRFFGK